MNDIEQRLENGIKHQSNRYISFRNKLNQLIEVQDKNTGILWKKVNDGWIWIA